jgi:hypothetical protein
MRLSGQRRNKKERSYYHREFLNKKKHGGTAFINVEAGENYANVTISDCSRQITLDFNTAHAAANTAHKLDILIREFTKLRDFLLPAEEAKSE